jgi:hypothetical protein
VVISACTKSGAGQLGLNPINALYSASGHEEGWAFWKASSFMQASNAAMVRGKPSKFTLNRLPLKIWGTKQQSANVRESP